MDYDGVPKTSMKHMTLYIDSLYWLSFGWRLIWREKSMRHNCITRYIFHFEKAQSFTLPASNLIKICPMSSMWIFGLWRVWLATVSALVVEPDHMAMASGSPDCGGSFQPWNIEVIENWSHFMGHPAKLATKFGCYWHGLNKWLVASWYLSSGFKQIQTRQLKLNLETATKKHRLESPIVIGFSPSPAFIINISSSSPWNGHISEPNPPIFRGATDGEDRFLAKGGLGAGQLEICWWPWSQIGIEDKHR